MSQDDLASWISRALTARNPASTAYFDRESEKITRTAVRLANRFRRGGRLLACGSGAATSDAQHVVVEFIHPVIVGKKALPAIDISPSPADRLAVELQPDDILMVIDSWQEPRFRDLVKQAGKRGALTLALPGDEGDFAFPSPSADPFIRQEIIEIVYHVLWESTHVFLEHQGENREIGDSSFLYPFLAEPRQDVSRLIPDVSRSISTKVREDGDLRSRVAAGQSAKIADCAAAIEERISRGGKLLTLGNGGSATDANDLARDCVAPPEGLRPLRALSLSEDVANVTAIANDIGAESVFLRQLIAQAGPDDAVLAISTSGSSKNVVLCLEEARRRGLFTAALLGEDGGDIERENLADRSILVPSDYIPRIQEVHASIYHVLREAIERLR